MTFTTALKNELSNQIIETENGAGGYASTGKKALDFFYKVSSYRSMDESEIIKDFSAAWLEDSLVAAKLLFFIGDIRQGLGERRTFKTCLKWLAKTYPDKLMKVMQLIPEYSRWDVLVDLCFSGVADVERFAQVVVLEQWKADVSKMSGNESGNISLLAKWLPSINTSSKEAVRKAWLLAKYVFNVSPKTYRKTLAALRAKLDIVEVKQCANEWDKIDYNTVPSIANLKYKDAFMNHDPERRTKYLEDLKSGADGVKINSSVAYPHDIVHKYSLSDGFGYGSVKDETDDTLEEMWKALPDYVKGDANTLCVVDGSGSMTVNIGSSNVSALETANSLGIYLSERMSGEFANKFITFSENPQFVEFDKNWTLRQKLENAYSYDECSNTDIEKTMDLILNTAKNAGLKQEELPKNLLILSDMEFDEGTRTWDGDEFRKTDEILFNRIIKKFEEAGYKMPRLIFWNLNSRTCAVPVKTNENGVILVSGFSPVVMEMVLSGELDPYKALLAKLNTERYAEVENCLKNI